MVKNRRSGAAAMTATPEVHRPRLYNSTADWAWHDSQRVIVGDKGRVSDKAR
jgi:hypothetical protein